MKEGEPLNLQEAQREATDIRELIGPRAEAHEYEIASEIIDMRKEEIERMRLENATSPLRFLKEHEDIRESLGYALITNQAVMREVQEKNSLDQNIVGDTLEQAFEAIFKKEHKELDGLRGTLAYYGRPRYPGPNEMQLRRKEEALEEQAKIVRARYERLSAFKQTGLPALKKMWMEDFPLMVQSKEDLEGALMISTEEMDQRLSQGETRLSELNNPEKKTKRKELETREKSFRKARIEEKQQAEQAKKQAEEAGLQKRKEAFEARAERYIHQHNRLKEETRKDKNSEIWVSSEHKRSEEEADKAFEQIGHFEWNMRVERFMTTDEQGEYTVKHNEVLHGLDRSAKQPLSLDDLKLGQEALKAWGEHHGTPSGGGAALVGALGDPEDLRHVLEVDRDISAALRANSYLFTMWVVDVGGRPGKGIMHTYGEVPDVIVDYRTKRISMLVEESIVGRYIGRQGQRIKAINDWIGKLGWRLDVGGAEDAQWGEVAIISKKSK